MMSALSRTHPLVITPWQVRPYYLRGYAQLSVQPATDVDLVAFVLRDVERVFVRIEPAVFSHGPTTWPLANAVLGQRVQETLDVGDKPAKVIEAVLRTFSFVHVAMLAVRQDCHGCLAVRRPAHHPVLCPYFLAGGRFAKTKDVDIKIEHLVIVGNAYGKVADAGKRP